MGLGARWAARGRLELGMRCAWHAEGARKACGRRAESMRKARRLGLYAKKLRKDVLAEHEAVGCTLGVGA